MTSPPGSPRADNPESRIPVLSALAAAIVLQLVIAGRFTLVPRWPLVIAEVALVAVLVAMNPIRLTGPKSIGSYVSWVLLTTITIDNTLSAAVLCQRIIWGTAGDNAPQLIGSGAAIYVTNILVFGIWYWELDGGGPMARHSGEQRYRGFQFAQMVTPGVAKPNWRPHFVDYLYLSLTNSTAFSPTDTMPLTRWAKIVMAVQAMVALSVAALVIARAVNVLT
ncbi:MAG: hypothetical protein AB7G47_17235 [Mycolicibacterium sp.]|uniref:hypothetical protein n=1 Tax=Mycolicibacterium sp. TaxID=2320850 RepID=UPI003D112DC3